MDAKGTTGWANDRRRVWASLIWLLLVLVVSLASPAKRLLTHFAR